MTIQPFHFKTTDVNDEGRFQGLAAVFGTVDQGGDIVQPGAFKASLAEHANADTKVVMLRDHDSSQPVGVWESIKETASGLEVVGRLTLGVEKARETLALLKDGALTGMSIGFQTITSSRDSKTGARMLEKLKLHEISMVSMPMHPQARVIAVKANEIQTKRDFEQFLRDSGFARQRAKILSTGFRPASNNERDVHLVEVAKLAQTIKERASAISI